ncbi:MAG: murein L,D-transpeptidase [Chlorobi bacterium CHB2]|nr:murein L,D-transpeptidase [Chlorobi bacterium CHB2]
MNEVLGDPQTDPMDTAADAEASRMDERSMRNAVLLFGGLILCGFLFVGIGSNDSDQNGMAANPLPSSAPKGSGIQLSGLVMSHARYLDTIYTTDSAYLEINLRKQRVQLHRRNGSPASFPVSTGNPYISEGMATPAGVFTVQNKTPMAISKQFNDAKLHWWIGIQGGIGFHGLDGNGYYWNLGVRPSSHGCVRMAREDIAQLYKMVRPGMLILVHGGSPGRIVEFCAPNDTAGATVIDSASVYSRNLGLPRLRSILDADAWIDPQPRIVHLAGQRLRWGMPMVESTAIPKQKIPTYQFRSAELAQPHESARQDRTLQTITSRWSLTVQRYLDSLEQVEKKRWNEEQKADPVL